MRRASRASVGAAGNAYSANYSESKDEGEEEKPSLHKAASQRVVKEELFDVTITREVQGGTLGIAVDLWDGEVTVGAITTNGPADKEGTLVQGDIIRAVDGQVPTRAASPHRRAPALPALPAPLTPRAGALRGGRCARRSRR